MTSKTTIVIALAMASVAGLTLARPILTGHFTDHQYFLKTSLDDMERKQSTLNLNASGAKRFRMDVQFGEVELVAGSGSEFKADITKEVNKPVSSEERRWLDNNWLKVKRDGDTIVLYEVESEKPDLNKSEKHHRNLNLKLKIQIPSGLDADLEMDAGMMTVQGKYRSFATHLDAGELTTKNFSSDQFVKLDLDAGEINANLQNVPREESSIKVDAGEISLNMKGNANVEASVGIGTIEAPGSTGDYDGKGLGSKQWIRVGSGGTKFKLSVDVGTINVRQGRTEKKTSTGDLDINIDLDKMDFAKDLDLDIDLGKDFGQDFDKDFGKDLQKTIESALKMADKEVEAALKEAEKELEKAEKETKRDFEKEFDKDMAPHVRELTQSAMKTARQAMALAREAIKKSMKKNWKDKGNEPI